MLFRRLVVQQWATVPFRWLWRGLERSTVVDHSFNAAAYVPTRTSYLGVVSTAFTNDEHTRTPLHGSLDQPHSAHETASWSVQPFLYSSHSRQSWLPLSPSLPLRMGNLDPVYYMVPWAHPCSQYPERHHDRFSCFCTAHGRDRQTDRQTDRPADRPRYAVCSSRPHL